ncbi:putative SH3 and multiple ankyrin repeat [Sesbania bispinosa]|nr:putative SH3 and multiple ankyrin repeat [Sesbania bispinosa]
MKTDFELRSKRQNRETEKAPKKRGEREEPSPRAAIIFATMDDQLHHRPGALPLETSSHGHPSGPTLCSAGTVARPPPLPRCSGRPPWLHRNNIL